MKRVLLSVVLATSFLFGFGVAAAAFHPWPWPYGLGPNQGYFQGIYESPGDRVLPQVCSGDYWYWNGQENCNSFPYSMDTAQEFIDFIKEKLFWGTQHEQTGAAFIIQTMNGGTAGDNPPTAEQIQEWEDRVFAIEPYVIWHTFDNYYNLNSYNQNGRTGVGPDDVALYEDNSNGHLSIVFRDASLNRVYSLKARCANPIGENYVGELPKAFNMAGEVRVNGVNGDVNVTPGSNVTFSHFLQNQGQGSTNPTDIWWTSYRMVNGVADGITGGTANSGVYEVGEQKNIHNEPSFTVPLGTAAGTQYCRMLMWDPVTPSARNGSTPIRCATVTAAYDLVPVVSRDKTTVQDGETVTFTFTVDNAGNNDSPSASCSTAGSQPAGLPAPPPTSCPQTFAWNEPVPIQVATQTITISGQAPGSQICRTLTVTPALPDGTPRTSPNVCVTVVKTPYVHFYGGDVWAGGGFKQADGSCPVTSNKITTTSRSLGGGSGDAGSMVEYAAFAQGPITQFGSASKALLSGAPIGNLARALSFANTSGTPGNFAAPTRCLEEFAAQAANIVQACPSSTVNVAAPPPNPCRITGNATFPQAALPNGSRQIYIVTGDVSIQGDITYPTSYASLAGIPSLVVIASGNIRIDGGVRQVDGIYVSKDTLFTCQEKPPLPTATCAQDMRVNGSVITKTLDLYRTAGAEGATPSDRRQPAEIFTLTPEVFLTNALNGSTKTVITTSESRELPPRF
ncbi:MAG TPA: hypothetical protein VFT87_01045 [Candidatus Saccharimonadales bacterium]|nr:hypothetical protein [Candidatus Saccharimonadales bacterium]